MSQTQSATLSNGATIPLIGFGTWAPRGRTAYSAIRFALDAGYRHIDTATNYGNETEVGRAVADSGVDRRDVFVTTKLPPENAGRERPTELASPGHGLRRPVADPLAAGRPGPS